MIAVDLRHPIVGIFTAIFALVFANIMHFRHCRTCESWIAHRKYVGENQFVMECLKCKVQVPAEKMTLKAMWDME
ncbi:MAG: hypothetical protein ACD_56C00041G0001 [uncultured bacterium]|nr:MAG: hypothetical protein ACD_56C00041G0001 [uncultured bacterium]